jgi:predicted peroxiredoxin
MNRIILAAVAAIALGQAAQAEGPALVTVVTSPEPQTQLMAMVLTMQAVKQGAKATVLLCGPGADIALRDAPATATAKQKPNDMSPQGLMQGVMKAGAKVEVCALYLPNKGVGPEALIEGVTVAAPPAMAGAMLADGARVWSF